MSCFYPASCIQYSAQVSYNNSMSALPLSIRSFEPADSDDLYRIDQTCFPSEIAFSRGEFIFYLNQRKSIAWIAETDGRIAGFVVARVESRFSAHVLTLDVVSEFRKRKVGTILMNVLHEELEKQNVGISVLEVGVKNLPAQRLYEKLHYRYVETLIGYYVGMEDAYRMVRTLGNRQSAIGC